MKSKFVRRLLAAGLTLALCLGLMATNVFAAGTVNDVKEKTGDDGSIVVTVYDNDPDASSDSGTGGETNVEDHVAVKDVSINALRIGSVVELTSTDASGKVSTQVAFGLDTTICEKLGVDTDAAIANQSGTYYFAPTAVQAALETANGAQSGAAVTQATIEAYVEGKTTDKKNDVTDEDGVATFDDLDYGLYLLAKSELPSNATTDLVPFLVSVPMYVEGEKSWNSTVYAYPKVRAAEITIAKTVDDNDSKDYTVDDDKYVNAGQTLNFTVTTTIPAAETGNSPATKFTSFVITDTNAGNSLNLNETNIENTKSPLQVTLKEEKEEPQVFTLFWDGIASSEYEALEDGEKAKYDYYYSYNAGNGVLTVTLTDAGLVDLNGWLDKDKTLNVMYKANVATDVNFSTTLTNTAKATYQREGMTGTADTEEATVNLYTYGIDLTKTLSESGVNINANTIKFELYTNATCTADSKISVVQGTGSDGGYWQAAADGSTSGEMVVTGGSTDGKLNLYGLEPGTYYLKETATMSGYALLEKPITIDITAPETPGDEPTATVNGANAQVKNGVVSLTVENTLLTAGFKLPQTGGAGTLAVTAIGLGLLCVGIILLVVYRKKGSKNS